MSTSVETGHDNTEPNAASHGVGGTNHLVLPKSTRTSEGWSVVVRARHVILFGWRVPRRKARSTGEAGVGIDRWSYPTHVRTSTRRDSRTMDQSQRFPLPNRGS